MKRVVVDEVTRSVSKGTCCTAEEDRTRQEDAKAADINVILRRVSDGVLPSSRGPGIYADVSSVGDFREARERVRRAEEAFAALDANVRSAFDNDPARFVDAFTSEDGVAKLRELKVLPETEETLADRREAAAEDRAARRALARERKRRMEEAARDQPPVVPAAKSPPRKDDSA